MQAYSAYEGERATGRTSDFGIAEEIFQAQDVLRRNDLDVAILSADRDIGPEQHTAPPVSLEEEEKAVEVVAQVEKDPTQKERICAALEKGENTADEVIKALVMGLGAAWFAGTVLGTALKVPAVMVASTLLILKMGSGYFCAAAHRG